MSNFAPSREPQQTLLATAMPSEAQDTSAKCKSTATLGDFQADQENMKNQAYLVVAVQPCTAPSTKGKAH